MQNNNENLPATFPLESVEKWQKVRKLAEAADSAKLKILLGEMELSAKLALVFQVAVSEETELVAVLAESQNEKWQELRATQAWLANSAPKTVEEAQVLGALRMKVAAEQAAMDGTVSKTNRATTHLGWLRTYFSELFGLPVPRHKGVLSAAQESPKTSEALRTAGVSSMFAVGAWRETNSAPESMAAARRRVYSSFSPIPAAKR